MISPAERSESFNTQHPQASSAFPTDPFVDRLPAGQTFETQALTQLRPNARSRSRPNLSISTDNTTFIPDNLPMIVQTPASDDMPMPVPPKPWVQQDVKATTKATGGMPLPLYYGYERPPPGLAPQPQSVQVSSQYLKPPSLLPSRQPQRKQVRIDPDTSTPITRLMTTTHARKSSQAVDPFVTPFDDDEAEARVALGTQTQTYAVSWPRGARNPFADPTATPRRPDSNPFATAIAV